ncbi:ankyrin repeat-containing domain protein [Aspergillus novoparasiticus]|uniref:Ankyrin repeat-containing domain protein n=1 Tax=Aspergillus novoparasiticus TaxID=986946 RepID=A0A5N6FCV1_9EURO|nr:ankyrin repeat-containing domain protein [Aspergillus novoparasiticus]
MAYSEFHHCSSDRWTEHNDPFLDTDGSILYETDYDALLCAIIERDDVATLTRYLAKEPRAAIAPSMGTFCDPFYIAAKNGSLNALRVLVDHHYRNADTLSLEGTYLARPNERGFLILNVACRHAHIEMVRFLLNREPPLGSVHAKDDWGETALLAAAGSLAQLGCDASEIDHATRDWMDQRIARGEELIHLLLGRGAPADYMRDQVAGREKFNLMPEPVDTVLGQAITRASYALVNRLIDAGADIHETEEYFEMLEGRDVVRDVTKLHIASGFWNTEGIRALLDHLGDQDFISMISCRDSEGRLPIHWAAKGTEPDENLLPENQSTPQITDTFKLLLANDLSTINVRDHRGRTALHYAVGTHICDARQGETVIRFLCENGADPSLKDNKGQTVLHILASTSIFSCPIDPSLLDLLIKYGADVHHADNEGKTALHVMAKNLQEVKGVQHLVNIGANVSTKDALGNTPLHGAMSGFIWPQTSQANGIVPLAERIRAQDEMIRVLQEAGHSSLMDQPNTAGKTPRQLFEETRAKWQKSENSRVQLSSGKGRGRPL